MGAASATRTGTDAGAPRRVGDVATVLGECPTWDPEEQRLYWLDVMGGDVFRLDPAAGAVERWATGRKPHALALRERGGMILTVRNGFWAFDPAAGSLAEIRDAAPHLPRNFVNDAKCDARGRLWAGSVDRDLEPGRGELYRFDPDLACHRMDGDVSVSNGIAWSPDGALMYHADTGAQAIRVYDFDTDAGTVANRRVFASTADLPGAPDGITVDRDGHVWSAQFGGGCLLRFDPAGAVERRVAMPVSRPTSCQFGGPALDVLYVTTASMGLSDEAKAAEPDAGGLFALDPGVRGTAPPRFAG